MPAGGAAALAVAAGLLLVSGDVTAAAAGTPDGPLYCYQCNVTDNSQCGEPQPCPSDQAYDRCSTTLRRRGGGQMRIIKGCTLGKCFLDGGATNALGLDQCDISRSKFDCVFCCTGDGCNVSSAQRISIIPALFSGVVFILLMLH